MSWSIWSVPLPAAGAPTRDTMALVLQVVNATAEDSPTYKAQFERPEVKDQVVAACAMLDEAVASGAVGDGPFTANLSGHANPGHQRQGDYGSDSITVTLVAAAPAQASAQ